MVVRALVVRSSILPYLELVVETTKVVYLAHAPLTSSNHNTISLDAVKVREMTCPTKTSLTRHFASDFGMNMGLPNVHRFRAA